MTLSPGTRLGPYEVQSAIGAGGKGEVHKAPDTRLDRSVGIKVLPAQASADQEHRRRFEREAKAVAVLNYPNIVTVHAAEEAEEVPLFTMEYVEGRPLAQMVVASHHPVGRREAGAEDLYEVFFLFGRAVSLR